MLLLYAPGTILYILPTQSTGGADKSLARQGMKQATATEDFDVFSTVHHSRDLFHLPTLMHNSFIY